MGGSNTKARSHFRSDSLERRVAGWSEAVLETLDPASKGFSTGGEFLAPSLVAVVKASAAEPTTINPRKPRVRIAALRARRCDEPIGTGDVQEAPKDRKRLSAIP